MKKIELVCRYYELWTATLLNLIEQVGIENVIDKSFIDRTNEIMRTKIKTKRDINYFHKKLMESRA